MQHLDKDSKAKEKAEREVEDVEAREQARQSSLRAQIEAQEEVRKRAEAKSKRAIEEKCRREELRKMEAAHNEAALITFYHRNDKARVADVRGVLHHYTLEQIVGLSMLRYGYSRLPVGAFT